MWQLLERVRRAGDGISGAAALAALALGLLVGVARADGDLVRAARMAYVLGEVTVLNADNPGGGLAQLNMPLTEGARVATGQNGEAEIEFEDGSVLRLTPQSSVTLSRLGVRSDGHYGTEIELTNGLVYAELRASSRYGYRINAGRDVVTPVANATIRILLDQPPAKVAVIDGTARVERAGAQADAGFQVDVQRGESLRGDPAGGGRYFLTQQIEHNSWDDWNEEREQGAANELTARTSARNAYAGDEGYGWSDLDANGTWYDAGGRGPVWQPYDASLAGFDPYGYGSWVWYGGVGYVWSSGYRWGWTPFRCGSWSYWPDFGWGWVPSGGGYRGGGGGGGIFGRRETLINLSRVPPGYVRPLPPVPGGPVRVHPIVAVHRGPAPTGEKQHFFEARQIAGETAMPLRPVGGGYTPRGGSAVGSSLRRDFPVDRTTRQPALGIVTAPVGRRGEAPAGMDALTGDVGGVGAPVSGSVGNAGIARPGRTGGSRVEGAGEYGGAMRGGGPVPAGREVRLPAPVRSGTTPVGMAGSVGVADPAASSVASPPPPMVRVHPIDRGVDRGLDRRVDRGLDRDLNGGVGRTGMRTGDGGGERTVFRGERSEQVAPVNPTLPPAVVPRPMSTPMPTRPSTPLPTSMPSERSFPSPPPGMRSAPATAPMQMRSAPAPAPAPVQVRSGPVSAPSSAGPAPSPPSNQRR